MELVERVHEFFKGLDPIPQFKATRKLAGVSPSATAPGSIKSIRSYI
jgi:WD40 repeat protein